MAMINNKRSGFLFIFCAFMIVLLSVRAEAETSSPAIEKKDSGENKIVLLLISENETRNYDGADHQMSTTYEYNSAGQVSKESFHRSDGTVTVYTYTYSDDGLTKVTYKDGDPWITDTYNSDGRLVREVYSDGRECSYAYVCNEHGDATKEIETIKDPDMDPFDVTSLYSYEYDDEGRIKKMTKVDSEDENDKTTTEYLERDFQGNPLKTHEEVKYDGEVVISDTDYIYSYVNCPDYRNMDTFQSEQEEDSAGDETSGSETDNLSASGMNENTSETASQETYPNTDIVRAENIITEEIVDSYGDFSQDGTYMIYTYEVKSEHDQRQAFNEYSDYLNGILKFEGSSDNKMNFKTEDDHTVSVYMITILDSYMVNVRFDAEQVKENQSEQTYSIIDETRIDDDSTIKDILLSGTWFYIDDDTDWWKFSEDGSGQLTDFADFSWSVENGILSIDWSFNDVVSKYYMSEEEDKYFLKSAEDGDKCASLSK